MNGRLVRKGLGYSKQLRMHKAQAVWEDVIYNVCWCVKMLREEVVPEAGRFARRWFHRTPTMAAGLTDHQWSIKELLRTIPVPILNNT